MLSVLALAVRSVPCAAAALGLLQDAAWDGMRSRAKELAERAFVQRRVDDLPEWLAKLDYDGYRNLRFRPACMLWAGDPLPFCVQFHHRGYLFKEKTSMWEISPSGRYELRFSPEQFDYGASAQAVPTDLGYSGFALRTRTDERPADASGETPGVGGIGSEFAAFQGASYYRLVPVDGPYGASARGLAIDTATNKGEEFPAFVEMWLEKPKEDAKEIRLYALLDSPSATGAFRFAIAAGAHTRAEVQASVFPRKKIEKLGLAPLTSMFLLGEDRAHDIADWRPEIHDSDGLLIQASDGGWTWRPLQNPPRTHRIERFPLENPAGFGLLQRDRSFASYQDLECRYEKRPSFWVTPRQPWGKGAVELVEIPTPGERNENIVVYWVPEKPVVKGEPIEFGYELDAFVDDPSRPNVAHARSVRIGPAKDAHIFVIDFTGEGLGAPADVRAELATSKGRVRNAVLQPNDAEGGLRYSFELMDDVDEPVEIRVTLTSGGHPVSETVVVPWSKP
jgi:glucans biosynthesis protein